MFASKNAVRVGLSAVALIATTIVADAKCTRLGFSVNDYGKDGPTKDAKALLDKYIASWAAENGIKKYTVGKKDVKCELFLDVILFDEHTCRAEAPVCWGDAPAKTASAQPAAATETKAPDATAPALAKPAAKPAAPAAKPKAAEAPKQ